MAEPKKGLGLILALGKPKDGDDDKSSPFGSDKPTDDKSKDELPPGFEEAAVEAFPDLEGDDDRIKAFWRSIMACTDSY